MEVIGERFGVHAGHRALHAKGVICAGTFTATPEAAELTRAAHMSGDPVAGDVRFSNGGGDPTVPDYEPDVRGLAVSFELPDGSRTDIVSPDPPRFPFRTRRASSPRSRSPSPRSRRWSRCPGFVARYPGALRDAPARRTGSSGRRSFFPARSYYAFHAYKWIDADGGERWVRYTWRPTTDEPEPSRAEAKRRGAELPVRRPRPAAWPRAGRGCGWRSRSRATATTPTTPPTSGPRRASGSRSARSR